MLPLRPLGPVILPTVARLVGVLTPKVLVLGIGGVIYIVLIIIHHLDDSILLMQLAKLTHR